MPRPHVLAVTASLAVLSAACQAPLPPSSGQPATAAAPPPIVAAEVAVATGQGPAVTAASARTSKLKVNVQAAARRLLAEVPRLTIADIEHIRLDLLDLNRASLLVATATLAGPNGHDSALGDAITFENLRANTTYRVVAEAFRAADEGVAGNLISMPDQFADVAVTTDSLAKVTLLIQLEDVPFAGTAGTTGISITPGGYASPTAAEVIRPGGT